MMAFLKKNWVTVLIVLATIILAGVAVYTAVRLYQLRQGPVAPNAPSSQPGAFDYGTNCKSLTNQESCQAADCKWTIRRGVGSCSAGNACLVSFELTASSSPTPSGSPTSSPSSSPSTSPSPTPTVPPSCGSDCTDDTDCSNGMMCTDEGLCRNPSCESSTSCLCASPTATPTTPLSCGDSCSSNSDCANNMVCSGNVCRNPSCLNSANCLCATSGPTSTPTIALGTSTPAPSLPESGTSTPALVGAGLGILLLLGAFVLAL